MKGDDLLVTAESPQQVPPQLPQQYGNPLWIALTSRGVIGGIVAIAAGILGFTAQETVNVTDMLVNAFAMGGGLLAIYGRVMARRRIAR